MIIPSCDVIRCKTIVCFTSLCDASVVQHDDLICMSDSREPSGHEEEENIILEK
jgi:hypothetical protein